MHPSHIIIQLSDEERFAKKSSFLLDLEEFLDGYRASVDKIIRATNTGSGYMIGGGERYEFFKYEKI